MSTTDFQHAMGRQKFCIELEAGWLTILDEVMQVSPLSTVTIPLPGLPLEPLIFSVKISALGTAFQCKTPAPRSKKRNKIPAPGYNLPGSNAKISMKKERNSIRAVSFQIFRHCSFDNFLLSRE